MLKPKLSAYQFLLALAFAQVTTSAVTTSTAFASAPKSCAGLFSGQSSVSAVVTKSQSPKSEAPKAEAKIGRVEVHAMSEPDQGARIKAAAETIARVANSLGLATPPHQLNIVPSGQLDILAGTGGHPAPHWHDGAGVIAAGDTRGVLEFVTKGCPTCRAFYSASTPFIEQTSVVMHVAGHNDMSSTSHYQTIRPGDSPLASIQLARALGKAYSEYDHDQVALFYQFMKSIDRLQDFVNGGFVDPSHFSNQHVNVPMKHQQPDLITETRNVVGGFFDNLVRSPKPRGAEPRSGWTSTYSVLQAFTEMLPVDAPEWQRPLMKLNEQSHRSYPAIFQTKIMNEGWATLQQYIIARHLPNVTSSELVKYAQLMSGVVRADFKNPYWLGLSGWMNIYEQFVAKPEMKDLSDFEKDKKFIAYARNLYARKNDSDWAKVAFDERWITKHKFFLYRPTTNDEIDWNQDPEKQKFIALTRNWKRVRNFIISQYVDVKYRQIPSIQLLNPNHTEGVVSLVQDTSYGIPLEITTATKTLFVISQIMQRSTQIDALFELQTTAEDSELQKKIGFPSPRPGAHVFPVRLKVSVKGNVSMVVDGEEIAPFAKSLEKVIDAYKKDVVGTFQGEMADFQVKQWTRLASEVSDNAASHVNNIVDFAPHTGPAIREYLQVVETRLRASVRDVLTGKSRGNLTGKGMSLPVLPEVPSFHYDNRFVQMKIRSKPPGPVDYPGSPTEREFHIDENGTKIGASGSKLPGDKWGPKEKEQDGKGKGEGEGEKGEPGEPDEEGEPGEPGTGGESGDPKDIKIPLKLYGELLGEVLELPNIRRTTGQIPEEKTIRRGSVAKPAGNVLWNETIIVAMNKARAIRRGKGLPYDGTVDPMTLVREALPLIEPGDIRVSGTMQKPMPDFEAVLLVNIDLTGSMQGERIKNAKNLVFNMKALLLAKYKKVKILYVGFDGTARELTEKQAFSTFFGGSTSYESAAVLDKEILARYPNSRFNKYLVTIGDAETSGGDAEGYLRELESMQSDLQYAGLAVTNERLGGMTDSLVQGHVRMKDNWPWLGIAHLSDSSQMLQALKDLFAGPEK